MASEALRAIMYQDFGEGCSCERCELSGSGAWRPPISTPDAPVASRVFSASPTSSCSSLAVRMATEP
eukprot:4220467-Prymnesium_polylepis.1